jgi:hypothetical protein
MLTKPCERRQSLNSSAAIHDPHRVRSDPDRITAKELRFMKAESVSPDGDTEPAYDLQPLSAIVAAAGQGT